MKVRVVSSTSRVEFETEVQALYDEGYRLVQFSTSTNNYGVTFAGALESGD